MRNTSPTKSGKVQMISMVSSSLCFKTPVVLPIVKASKSIVSEIENEISTLKASNIEYGDIIIGFFFDPTNLSS